MAADKAMKKLIRFFSSVKLAIVLIILLVAASIIGTLIPQGRDMAEYEARYGRMGAPMVMLQLTNIYRSVGFLALLGVFGLNLIACSLTRLAGKLRRAGHPRIESDPKELAGYKIKARFPMEGWSGGAEAGIRGGKSGEDGDGAIMEAVKALEAARYKVRTAGNHLLARKRIDGIFGSDIVHLGLLVIIAGGILTGLAGFRTDISLNPGETREVPRAGFSVRLERFDTEMYPGGGIKDWKSTVAVVEDGRDIRTQVVEVNHPLVHKGFSLYQMAYGMNWEAATLELRVGKKGEGTATPQAKTAEAKVIKARRGEIVKLGDPEMTEVLVRQFIPDFILGENNQPESRSLELNNPAAYIEVRRGGKNVAEGWVFGAYPEVTRLRGEAAAETTVEFIDLEAPQYSVLQAAKDPGVPLIWAGCLLVMAGLFLAFYRPTWEIRIVLETADGPGRNDGAVRKNEAGKKSGAIELTAGGIAAKSRDRFEIEFARVMDGLRSGK